MAINDRALTVEEMANKLRPIYGDKIDKLYFRYAIAEGREEKEDIAHLINTLYQKNLKQLLDRGVLLEPPEAEAMDGTYTLGTVRYAGKTLHPFNLREKDWPRHVCITGMSGSGKTTLAFAIIDAFNQNKKPYLIFDWKKSFRPLLKDNAGLMIFTIGDEKVSNMFKTNINKPPKGVAPKEWINVLTDLLVECFAVSFGVHKVVLETLDEAFKEWGIYNGSDNYPTWNHIKWRLEEKLDKHQGREAGWLESALRIATVLTFGEFGKTVNYKGKNAVAVEDLLDKQVIMELNALGNVEKTFFCDFVLTYLYKMKKARQNEASHGFDHAIVVDEAHNIFLKKPTSFTNESVTDMIYREMREYGTALVCLDQHISKISDTVKGNSACHIAFQQQLPADIEDVSRLMQIYDKRQYFSHLPVGRAIVKLSERYTSPFLVEVPKASIRDHNVTNQDVKGRMQAVKMGQEFEQGTDEEFNEQLVDVRPLAPATPNPAEKAPQSVSQPADEAKIKVRNILLNFVHEQLGRGISLADIIGLLEESKYQGGYETADIAYVVQQLQQEQEKKNPSKVVTLKKAENPSLPTQKPDSKGAFELNEQGSRINEQDPGINRPQENSPEELQGSSEEVQFLDYLKNHPDHELSTTQFYKAIGLSPRKGNKVKDSLKEKNLIRIEEVKYDKGWKKYIRLN